MDNETVTVKKAYADVYLFLCKNKERKVADVLDAAADLMRSHRRASSDDALIKNVAGDIVAIRCAFFARWMPLVGDNAVEFGAKKNGVGGLYNPMCRVGQNIYSKRRNDYIKSLNAFVVNVIKEGGSISSNDAAEYNKKLEAARDAKPETKLGFAQEKDCIAYLTSQGQKINQ